MMIGKMRAASSACFLAKQNNNRSVSLGFMFVLFRFESPSRTLGIDQQSPWKVHKLGNEDDFFVQQNVKYAYG